jgi:outer membrane receptor protein involved in Fe transport
VRKLLIQLLAISLAAPFSTGALAQSDEAEDGVLEEIIVTSTRREKTVMEISQSVQAIPEAVLELPTFNDLTDVTALIPGATGFSNKPPQEEGIQFRGSGISQASVADGLSPVGYYVDDIPYVDVSTPVPPPIGTFDLARIEVVRGPQGTSYGQDSSAGSIILRTNPVDLENFGYKVRAGISDVASSSGTGYTIGGVVNIPIAEDVFGVRIAYLLEEDSGYGYVAGRPDIDDAFANTRDSIRIKAHWQASENIDFELTHSEWNTDYNTLPASQIIESINGGTLIREPTSDMMLALFPDGRIKNDFEIRWTTLLAKFDLGFAELTSSTGYVDTPKKETNLEEAFDGSNGPAEFVVVFNQPAETFTQEFRLLSTGDSNLQWITGLFYMDAESDSGGFVDLPTFFFRYFETDPVDSEVWAVYGDIEYAVNDQWSVQAGLRYQDEDRSDTYTQDIADPFADPLFGPYSFPGTPETNKTTFDHISYRLGLTWTPEENGMVYLTYSIANRAPIIQPLSNKVALENAGIVLPGDSDAAELVNTELGTKWTLADGRVQLEAAFVFSDWQDIPLWADLDPSLFPPFGLSLGIGGTDAEITIWELSLAWALNDNFTVNYSGAFTDTEVTKVPSDAEIITGYPPAVKEGGELFNYSPETHNFGIAYNQSLARDWELSASLNYVTRDKPDGIDAFDLSAPEFIPAREEFENLSFSLSAARGPWDLSFAIQNATDFDGMYFPSSANVINGFIPQPTTYSFQVSYDGMP